MSASYENDSGRLNTRKNDILEETDIQIAQKLLHLFGFSIFDGLAIDPNEAVFKEGFIELATKAITKMENPFAKDLLKAAILRWKLEKSS